VAPSAQRVKAEGGWVRAVVAWVDREASAKVVVAWVGLEVSARVGEVRAKERAEIVA